MFSVAELLDTGSASGRLVITIMTAVSQWEREAIGERTREALQHKLASGQRAGNVAYGYRVATDGEHVEPDAGEQGVLARVRKLRAEGQTLRGIAEALNARGLRTRRGSPWRHTYIASLLEQRRMIKPAA